VFFFLDEQTSYGTHSYSCNTYDASNKSHHEYEALKSDVTNGDIQT